MDNTFPVERGTETAIIGLLEPRGVGGLEKESLPVNIWAEHFSRKGFEVEEAEDESYDFSAHSDDARKGSQLFHNDKGTKVELHYDFESKEGRQSSRYVETIWENEIETMLDRVEDIYDAAEEFVYDGSLDNMTENMNDSRRDQLNNLQALNLRFGQLGEDIEEIAEKYYSGSIGSEIFESYAARFENAPEEDLKPNTGALTVSDREEERLSRNTEYLKTYLETVAELAVERHQLDTRAVAEREFV